MSQRELDPTDQIAIIFDVSGSMGENDTPTGESRLKYAINRFRPAILQACDVDPDGVDIGSFGAGARWLGKANKENLDSILDKLTAKEGGTDTAAAVKLAWDLHVANRHKQTFLFLITDGAPNSKQALRDQIVDITNKLKDEHEFAISIDTVGDLTKPDMQATKEFLRELDDDLPGAKYDIVDCKELKDVNDLIELAAGALHD